MFPFLDDQDVHTVGFSGRRLSDVPNSPAYSLAKYMNNPNSLLFCKRHYLWGLGGARRAMQETGQVILVEGNFARLRLLALGTRQVVAPCGTALTRSQAEQLTRVAQGTAPTRAVSVTISFDEGARRQALASAITSPNFARTVATCTGIRPAEGE